MASRDIENTVYLQPKTLILLSTSSLNDSLGPMGVFTVGRGQEDVPCTYSSMNDVTVGELDPGPWLAEGV